MLRYLEIMLVVSLWIRCPLDLADVWLFSRVGDASDAARAIICHVESSIVTHGIAVL